MTNHSVNLADLFEVIVDVVPQRTAVALSDGFSYTYQQMDDRGNRCAHMLAGLGVERGDRVAVVAHNRIEWLDVFLGCFKIRALAVNINYRYTASEITHIIADCEPKVVVVEAALAEVILTCLQTVRQRAHVVVLDMDSPMDSPGSVSYSALLADMDPARVSVRRSGNDGYLLYTGGTTGLPKGVYWKHHNLFHGALNWGPGTGQLISDVADGKWDQRPATATMAVAPLMHGNGQWAVLRAWASAGTAVVWVGPTFDAPRVWDTVQHFGVEVMSIVGDAMATPLLAQLQRNPARWDLSSLVAFGSGGAVLSPHVKAGLKQALPHVQIVDGYGGSEAGTIGTRAGADGEKPPRFEVRPGTAILRSDLSEAAVGETGLLAASGAIASGYWRDDKKTAEVFRTDVDGRRWAVIGDNAVRNEDGTITLLGRGSLVVNTGGEKVFPDEVESVLKEHPAVLDTIVVGVDDPLLGEQVAAVIAIHPACAMNLAELQAHARKQLAGYKIPRTVAIVDEIRRSPAGKADYNWAREVANAVGSTS